MRRKLICPAPSFSELASIDAEDARSKEFEESRTTEVPRMEAPAPTVSNGRVEAVGLDLARVLSRFWLMRAAVPSPLIAKADAFWGTGPEASTTLPGANVKFRRETRTSSESLRGDP